MWEAESLTLESGRVEVVSVLRAGERLSYAEVIDLWQRDEGFRNYFRSLLADASYEAYFWETPPVTRRTVDRPFQFAVVESSQHSRVHPEPDAFRSHFASSEVEQTVLTFPNLGGDALLVVPRPLGPLPAYAHLGVFVREAPATQIHALWQAAGAALESQIGTRPIWLSTAGLGVYWLHLRLDSRPKYYRYQPYKATHGAWRYPRDHGARSRDSKRPPR